MHPKHKRRLAAAGAILAVLAALSIWFSTQRRHLMLNRALIAAIKRSDAVRVDALLASGANPNARVRLNNPETLQQQLKRLLHPLRADLTPTALMVALNQRTSNKYYPHDYSRIVKALLRRGANVKVTDYHELTPVSALFCYYSDDDVSFTFGMTVTSEMLETLKMLLAAGADVNRAGPSHQTPLMLACEYGEPETARILLDHGANPNPKAPPGDITPLMLAKRDGDASMEKLLKAHGAKE
jgi:ankyrin repeat protein